MARHVDHHGKHHSAKSKVAKEMRGKVHKVMGEFKRGTLHSGSEHGPEVTERKQAVAIALNEARRSKRRKHK